MDATDGAGIEAIMDWRPNEPGIMFISMLVYNLSLLVSLNLSIVQLRTISLLLLLWFLSPNRSQTVAVDQGWSWFAQNEKEKPSEWNLVTVTYLVWTSAVSSLYPEPTRGKGKGPLKFRLLLTLTQEDTNTRWYSPLRMSRCWWAISCIMNNEGRPADKAGISS